MNKVGLMVDVGPMACFISKVRALLSLMGTPDNFSAIRVNGEAACGFELEKHGKPHQMLLHSSLVRVSLLLLEDLYSI